MTTAQIRQLGNTVGFVLGANRPAVIALLRNNGATVSNKTSTEDLIDVTIDKVLHDPTFNKGFDRLAKETARQFLQATKQSASANANGGGSFDWGGLAGGILSAGTGIFGTIQANKAQEKLAKQQAKLAELEAQTQLGTAQAQIEIERLRLQQLQAQKAGTPNTLVYVGIGLVGLLVIGGVIFAVRK